MSSEGLFGQFHPTGNNRLLNVGEEIAFGAAKGGTGSFLGAAVTNALFEEDRINLGRAFADGAVSGAATGAASWAKYGAALRGPSDPDEEAALEAFLKDKNMPRPDFRTGGLQGGRFKRNAGVNVAGLYDGYLGGKAYIYGDYDNSTFLHETVHMWQQLSLGNELFGEMVRLGRKMQDMTGINRHRKPGTLEYQARWYQYYYHTQYGYPWKHGYVPSVPAF